MITKDFLRTGAAAAAALAVGGLAVFAFSHGGAQEQPETLPGARNYTRVDATVACGGATPADAMPALREMGFAGVINLRQASEPGVDIDASRAAARSAGLRYIHLPFNAAAPDSATVEAFLAAVADPANQPVYIHCGTANRVGAVWLIKRVLQDGWSVESATAEAEAIGLSSPALKRFALDYVNRD